MEYDNAIVAKRNAELGRNKHYEEQIKLIKNAIEQKDEEIKNTTDAIKKKQSNNELNRLNNELNRLNNIFNRMNLEMAKTHIINYQNKSIEDVSIKERRYEKLIDLGLDDEILNNLKGNDRGINNLYCIHKLGIEPRNPFGKNEEDQNKKSR